MDLYKSAKHSNQISQAAKGPNLVGLRKPALEVYILEFKVLISNENVLSEDPKDFIKPRLENSS